MSNLDEILAGTRFIQLTEGFFVFFVIVEWMLYYLRLEGERERQIYRQSDRQTDRQKNRQTDRQTNRKTNRKTDRQPESNRTTERQKDRKTELGMMNKKDYWN